MLSLDRSTGTSAVCASSMKYSGTTCPLVMNTAGTSKANRLRNRDRASASSSPSRYVISVSPKTHIRPNGVRVVCPARANPGEVMSGSEAARSRDTSGVNTSRPSVWLLASRMSPIPTLLKLRKSSQAMRSGTDTHQASQSTLPRDLSTPRTVSDLGDRSGVPGAF